MRKKDKVIETMRRFPNLNKWQIAQHVGCHVTYAAWVITQYRKDMFMSDEPTNVQDVNTIDAVLTGGSSSYYKLQITHPTSDGEPYTVECNDIIEALGMTYAEGNALKAVWRYAALRQGRGKPGSTLKYEAEKIVFFGERMLEQAK